MVWSLRSETSCLACRREARKSLISNETAASPEMIAARCILAASILCYEGLLRSLYKLRGISFLAAEPPVAAEVSSYRVPAPCAARREKSGEHKVVVVWTPLRETRFSRKQQSSIMRCVRRARDPN